MKENSMVENIIFSQLSNFFPYYDYVGDRLLVLPHVDVESTVYQRGFTLPIFQLQADTENLLNEKLNTNFCSILKSVTSSIASFSQPKHHRGKRFMSSLIK